MKIWISIIAVIIVLTAAIFIFSGKNVQNPSQNATQAPTSSSAPITNNNNSNQTSTQTTVPASGQNTTAQNNVAIKNFSFSPSVLNIGVGQEVTWTNNDSVPHPIKADSGAFESGVLNLNETYKVLFTQPGTFNYYCSIHPSMTGQIIVK